MKFRHRWYISHGRILRRCAPAGLVMLGMLGCGDTGPAGGGDGPPSCTSGQVAAGAGVCMPAGIQGCAEAFVEADGLCRPSIDKCPAGTIPKFDEGCIAVGIPDCADLFVEADGFCHPSIDKCSAGTIPKFDEGCAPVGIPNCAPEFLEADGLCHPSMTKCPAGSFAAPQKGCIPIDGPGGCGTGTWGNLADGPNTVYVDPTYPGADSDGSKAKPVKTIAAALGIVPSGGRIVLAAGLYAEAAVITKTLTLEGRCPSMVRIEGSVDALGQKAVVWVNSAQGVVLRGMEIGGPGIGVLASFAPALAIDRVHIRQASVVGLFATGSTTELTVSQSLIEGTLPDGTGKFGYGADLSAGVQATFTDSAFFANHYGGVHAKALGTKLTMIGNLIEGTLAQQSDQESGRGMNITANAQVSMTGNALVANRDVGIFANGNDTEVTVEGNLIEGTLTQASDQRWGTGIELSLGVKATLTGNAILDNHNGGIKAASTGTELTATGNLVMGTLPEDGTQSFGYGIAVGLGAYAMLNDNALLANHRAGLSALEPGTDVTAVNNLIEGTLPDQIYTSGHGIQVRTGARATLTGNAHIRNSFTGLFVTESGTDATVQDSLIENTLPVDAGGQKWYGIGAVAGTGARATIRRSALLGNSRVGIVLQDAGTDGTLAGSLVKATRPDESADGFGWGCSAQFGARATLQDNALIENHQTGLGINDIGTDVTVTGTLIERTLSSETSRDFGLGVQVSGGALASLDNNALIENHYLAFLMGSQGTTVTMTGNLIEGTLPRESDGEYGGGILFESNASLKLASSLLRNNRGFAVLGYSPATAGAAVTSDLSHNFIDGVTANSFTLMEPPMTYTDIGDGILMIRGSVSLTGNKIEGCTRAGVLFQSSSGSLTGVIAANNQFGLVLQGSPWPAYEGAGNTFGPNAKQDIVLGGNLVLPDKPAPIPPPPAPL